MKRVMKNVLFGDAKTTGGFTVRDYSKSEKEKILDYMKSFEPYAVAGMVYDYKTGKQTREENTGFSDGMFLWSSQDIYHIERYNAAVSEDFFKKVIV